MLAVHQQIYVVDMLQKYQLWLSFLSLAHWVTYYWFRLSLQTTKITALCAWIYCFLLPSVSVISIINKKQSCMLFEWKILWLLQIICKLANQIKLLTNKHVLMPLIVFSSNWPLSSGSVYNIIICRLDSDLTEALDWTGALFTARQNWLLSLRTQLLLL